MLRAFLDRVIPADDFPGASEAGCGEYLRRLLVLPEDFRMTSRYGVPEGGSLTDWPLGGAVL